MHPLLTHLRGLAAYLSAWMLAGCVLAVASGPQSPGDWAWRLGFVLPLAVLTGMAALAMYPVCRSFPFRPARWLSLLARRAVAAGVLALGVSGVAALWNTTGLLWGRNGLVTLAPPAWLALMGLQAVVFAVSALVHDALLAQQALQAVADNAAQARLLAREMEIKVLRKQLDPHFLFNSLNSISALIQLNPAAARAMTVDLASFFRQTLSLGERERIRLDQELELVQHYLAVEQHRLIEAQADHVAFHQAGRDHLKAPRISELEAQLDPRRFVRVHRSFIVNLRQVQALERTDSSGHAVRLKSGKRIPVSRSGHERLLAVL